MRTTITLSDNVYQTLKTWAAESGESISSIVEKVIKNQVFENPEDLQPINRTALKTASTKEYKSGDGFTKFVIEKYGK